MSRIKYISKQLTWFVAALLAISVAGCGSGTTAPATSANLASIAVTPATATVAAAATQQFVATATYNDGTPAAVVTASTSWTSATPGVATINSTSGLATGVAAGTSVITGSFGGKTATATLTVTAAATTVLPGAGVNPTVISSSPTQGDINVPTGSNSTIAAANNTVTGKLVTATFSTVMDPATLTPVGVFTLKETIGGANVSGAVTMNLANTMGYAANRVAIFTPTTALTPNTSYTATITTAAQISAANAPISQTVAWSFTTKSSAITGQEPVDLLSILTNNFVILSKTGITQATPTLDSITGNIGVSSTTGASITVACTDLVVGAGIGEIFTDDATPVGTCVSANKTAASLAVADMGTAYTEAGGRTNPTPAALASDITNLILNPGIHTTAGGVLLNVGTGAGVTLDCLGDSNAVFIFQIATTLTVGPGAPVTLVGSCQAKNVFWVVQGAAAIDTPLDTTSQFKGNLLTLTTIALQAGATINGRLMSQTQVTLIGNTVSP